MAKTAGWCALLLSLSLGTLCVFSCERHRYGGKVLETDSSSVIVDVFETPEGLEKSSPLPGNLNWTSSSSKSGEVLLLSIPAPADVRARAARGVRIEVEYTFIGLPAIDRIPGSTLFRMGPDERRTGRGRLIAGCTTVAVAPLLLFGLSLLAVEARRRRPKC